MFFHVLTIVNNTAVNTEVHVSFCLFFKETFNFVLECNQLIMLWQFLFSKLLSYPGCHITLSRVPFPIQ